MRVGNEKKTNGIMPKFGHTRYRHKGFVRRIRDLAMGNCGGPESAVSETTQTAITGERSDGRHDV
jgi:hypothetical protein